MDEIAAGEIVSGGREPSIAGTREIKSPDDLPDRNGKVVSQASATEEASQDRAVAQRLHLDNEDLRFDRDRYRASAADFQAKLLQALDELDQMRPFQEKAERASHEMAALSREFEHRLAQERQKMASDSDEELQALRTRLGAAHADQLRHEIISLAREFEAKLARATESQPACDVHVAPGEPRRALSRLLRRG